MDAEADVTIVNSHLWTPTWLTRPTSTAFIGLASSQSVSQSALPLPCVSHGGQTGTVTPCVAPIPVNPWGINLMKEWDTLLPLTRRCVCHQLAG